MHLPWRPTCAVIAALILGCGLVSWEREARRHRFPCPELIPIVVAARPIPTGTTVTSEDVEQRMIPAQFLRPHDARAEGFDQWIDGIALRDFAFEEPLTLTDIAPRIKASAR